ncbi:hypothetical protein [Nocardia suismassiliense]|uniref:hypothetical protein n=1 Tax=Nocardia suismassiliense TaxID=2077092 RepID=UPI000D1EA02B|nr:hypothetical protein [Nocardia suismassiliense]
MTGRQQVQWGVLIGQTVRPLPKARNVTDAVLYACHLDVSKRMKTSVVYRDSDTDSWCRWIDETPVPTQLALDLYDKEAQ